MHPAMRTFRVLRVFKLARSWKGLRSILNCVLNSLDAVGQLLALFTLVEPINQALLPGLAYKPEGLVAQLANPVVGRGGQGG